MGCDRFSAYLSNLVSRNKDMRIFNKLGYKDFSEEREITRMKYRNIFLGLLLAFTLVGCSRLDTIPSNPPQTPDAWLVSQPYLMIDGGFFQTILIQPSTTAIVYLLGLITIFAGIYFLRIREKERSRFWWGIALLLWGVGALLAGTSYEGFSYSIKCLGREICIWTSWWEVVYLFLSVASVNAMLIAQSYACAEGQMRRRLKIYAFLNLFIYTIILLIGSFIPVKFLISFELLIFFCAPTIIIFLIMNSLRLLRYKLQVDKLLLGTWIWLSLTIAAYFLYYISGLTSRLWSQGIWFTENDVLHIGLIIWMLYLVLVVANKIKDI